MIYANDEIFNIGYNSKFVRTETENKKISKGIRELIKNNKMITVLLILFTTFSFMNGIFIYTFMQILKTI